MTEMQETLVAAQAAMPADAGTSYWQVVRRAYFRRILNTTAVVYVVLVGLIAIFVPFIANGRPYVAVVDGVQRYPLFKALTRVDLIILVIAGAAALYGLTCFFTRRENDIELRQRRRRIVFRVVVLLALISSLLLAFLKKDYNDLLHREDYKQLTPDYDVRNAVFPPLDWGFDDGEYPRREGTDYQDPSRGHWLGTDGSSRDTLTRLMWSARIVFGIGLISQVIASVIGVIYGAMMGYFGGKVDILGSRFMEMVDAVPTLFLVIIFVALFGRQIFMIMVILGLVGWTGLARFVRAEFFKLRKVDFVQAAIASGLPLRAVLFKHILPNALTPVLVNVTFGVAAAVTIESSLSFLGLGVEPPTPSWGSMLDEAGNPGSIFHLWLATAPGVMIFLTVFAYNIIGEGLRDAFDPKTNKLE
jgi:peptide/nickel transport system permease protein